jgi:hypothetical protein
MRSFEQECALVATRHLLWTTKKERQLGLATYLWMDEFLLDSGKKILGENCRAMVAPDSAVPPFEITLQEDTRVFEGMGRLINTGYWLHAGERVTIRKIEKIGWNHGDYAAGRFFYRGEPYWFVMSEVKLPMETPYLQLVS